MVAVVWQTPSDIQAVVVGLEMYPSAGWQLPGVSAEAIRFARWLRNGGVPAQNIHLLLAPAQARYVEATLLARQLGIEPLAVTSSDQLREFFKTDLAIARGSLLYVYWGGHGAVTNDERRILFGPDATDGDLRAFDLGELRRYLTRSEVGRYAQQVFFIDSCAGYLQDYGPDKSVLIAFPPHIPQTVEQFVLHAAAIGQESAHDPVTASGPFSDTLLGWLERDAPDLRVDLRGLTDYVRNAFAEMTEVDGGLQRPVSLYLREADQEVSEPFFPPDNEAQLHHNDLVARLITALPDAAMRERYRGLVASECGTKPSARGNPDDAFAILLLRRSGAMAALLEALFNHGLLDAAEGLSSASRELPVPGLLSPRERKLLTRELYELPPVPLPVRAELWRRILPRSDAPFDPEESLAESALRLEPYRGGISQVDPTRLRVPPLLRYVEHVGAAHGGDGDSLRRWSDVVARRLGVAPESLEERRAEAREWADQGTLDTHVARLVLEVTPESDGHICIVWIDPGTGSLSRTDYANGDRPLNFPELAQLVDGFARTLSEDITIEIIVPHRYLPSANIARWEWRNPVEKLDRVMLAVRRRIVFRCARLNSREDDRQQQLKKRWLSVEQGKAVYLDEASTRGDDGYRALQGDMTATRAIICPGNRRAGHLIKVAAMLGYPVVIWDVTKSLPESAREHFAPIQPEGDLDGLPERIRIQWSQAHPHVSLVLENANLPLPEPLPLIPPGTRRGKP
ncbi:caspase family protein [Dactylosporangium sp. CS-033363]|uniref:caspase family protein n=1 Tax=Dactylosporangium sp. CS-033363 TaxID=3239935 RepID=UPI003D91F2CD